MILFRFQNLVLIFSLYFFLSKAFSQTNLKYEDHIYMSSIRTPLLYLNTNEPDQTLMPPIMALNQKFGLQCEFDDIGSQSYSYYYKIINCNSDWTPNDLIDSEYLKEFMNDQIITQYNLSFNTREKYVHYRFVLPKIKISGNFLLIVYKNGNIEDLAFSMRFLVYEEKIIIQSEPKLSTGIAERYTHQQIDFTIRYDNYASIYNPLQDIKTVVRQNYRWDNMLDLKPLYVKEAERILDYNFFNLENNFPGGKEFRFFDCRKVYSQSMNIERIDMNAGEINVYLMQEKERNSQVYSFGFDANGRYVIANNEVGAAFQDPDYVWVNFNLKSVMQYGEVYVLGGMNNYKPSPVFKMNYDGAGYTLKTKLKMGYYNYVYGVKNQKSNEIDYQVLEGSSAQTENVYEIIVYNRPIGGRYDMIIGYNYMKYNGQ